MQNTRQPQQPLKPQQPSKPFLSSPHQSHKRKRFLSVKRLAGVGGILGAIAAILAILQFTGIQNLGNLISTFTPPPSLPPITDTTNYMAKSPGCETGDPPDIAWAPASVLRTCLPENGGTKLDQTDKVHIPQLVFQTTNKKRLASYYDAFITLTGIAPKVCAGLIMRVRTDSHLSYGFFICGSGNWYIAKYLSEGGGGTVLMQSTRDTQEQASDRYTMQVGIRSNEFAFSTGGRVHAGQDLDFVSTVSIGIAFGEEGSLTSFMNSTFLTSITVMDFSYSIPMPCLCN